MQCGPPPSALACSPATQAVARPAEKEENRRAKSTLRTSAPGEGHRVVKFWRLPGWRLRCGRIASGRGTFAPTTLQPSRLASAAGAGGARDRRRRARDGVGAAHAVARAAQRGRRGGDGRRDRRRRRLHRRRQQLVARRRLFRRRRPLAAAPDLPVSVDHASAASSGGRIYVTAATAPTQAAAHAPSSSTGAPGAGCRSCPTAARPQPRRSPAGALRRRRAQRPAQLAKDAFALKLGSPRWVRIPGPTPREHLAAAASRNRVYAIGGRAAGSTRTRPLRGLRRRRPALARARAAAGSARRHGRGRDRRAHRLGRRRGAGRHDQASSPTTSGRAAGHDSPTSPPRAMASAWSRRTAGCGPSPAGPFPGSP